MDMPAKMGDSNLNGSRDTQQRSRRRRNFRPLSSVDKFRPGVYSDILSYVVVDPTGVKIPVKFGDSRFA